MQTPHYLFAHIALRQICLNDPRKFFDIIESPDQREFIENIWALVCDQCGVFDFEPVTKIKVSTENIQDYHTIIIEMPPPGQITEAYFIAVVLCENITTNGCLPEQPELKYFTLEKTIDLSGKQEECTMFCGWRENTHLNYGSGPTPEKELFIAKIADMLSGKTN